MIQSFRIAEFKEPSVSFPYTREEFIAGLRKFQIGSWESEYDNPLVLDGRYWEMEFEFAGDIKPVRIHGSNAYPKNRRRR